MSGCSINILVVRMAIGRYATNVANITAASSLDCEHADTLNQQYLHQLIDLTPCRGMALESSKLYGG